MQIQEYHIPSTKHNLNEIFFYKVYIKINIVFVIIIIIFKFYKIS